MHPSLIEVVVQQRIDELNRTAEARRSTPKHRKPKAGRSRKRRAMWFQRAPAA